ncbi:3-hydroxyisobutyryl-CoA hydrolase-like protein [Emiliania huxleyi CCMP1516]|uniref:3-hydroxyisobutyryl-CoA hydrolase n=2 Tax=Emiliania huxleyi TaxID=2903 RepID=A0A0D3I9N7_EMIH1|nr:3-hydroxyisobutyryl-CoA hydrolase-like protein [Emiliania huxleyi CCMP1516]EOD07972.1 3-hydroxyisobutyryl-CoA hydrolase-like protein [Emiliania huxleyi CCMP1516]|eukprot:XP_005760401.1 3-hydroxyisobutyryl-CoA hydrolase-like protein [Emiliania huxleyi CCMP1516]
MARASLRAAATLRELAASQACGAAVVLRAGDHSFSRPRVLDMLGELSAARAARTTQSAVLMGTDGAEHGSLGSNMAKVARMDAAARAKHFQELANLMRSLGTLSDGGGWAPAVVALDGVLCGSAVGAALHAPFFVATERTRLCLPGPSHGCPPESLASHRLARLPHALGRYLALTGAALTGPECYALGLATHLCEAHALPQLADALGEGFSDGGEGGAAAGGEGERRLLWRVSRRLSDACVELPPLGGWGEEHALYYAPQVEAAFSRGSLPEVLREASPLALSLTFAQLRAAEETDCWAAAARAEAESCAAAAATADFRAGAGLLHRSKVELLQAVETEARRRHETRAVGEIARRAAARAAREEARGPPVPPAPPAWEHGSVEEVEDEAVARLVTPLF